jgi:hypothetical protein
MRVDEQKLTGLFQSAVRDAPPASFDAHDVAMAAAAEKRTTMRRRTWIIGGGGFVVAFLAVGLVLGGGSLGDALRGTSSSGAAAGSAPVDRNLAPGVSGGQAQARVPSNETRFPTATPLQGGGGVGGVGPGAGGTPSGCGPTDGQLAVALAHELSSVGAPPQAIPASVSCPAGSRVAAYLVHDGSDNGYVVAVVTPAGKATAADSAVGVARAIAAASGGRQVTVLSVPATTGATAPLTGALFGIAMDLAGKV